MKDSDGIIIVTPEYNGGYPASLKNVIDLLYIEWQQKPISLATVSSGSFGGSQVTTSLQFSLWKIGTIVLPNVFMVSNVAKTIDENGNALNPELLEPFTQLFIKAFISKCNAL